MRLSFYTYSYTERLDLPIAPCVKRIAETGYSGFDLSATYGASDDPRSFDAERRRLTLLEARRNNLRIEAIITHANLTDTLADPSRPTLDLAASVDMAAEMDADIVTFHMGGYPDQVDNNNLWGQVVDTIRSEAEYAASKDVRLAVDGIWPPWINSSPEKLTRLFDDVGLPQFGVNLDPSYLTLMGVDPVGFIERFANRIVHGHLKDHTGTYPDWTHQIPGAGDMDYSAVFAALKKNGFSGSVAVECFIDMPFVRACDDAYTTLTQAAAKAGIKM